jgi:multidrug efflux pump subunit AcrA (membrane-fusion protein)
MRSIDKEPIIIVPEHAIVIDEHGDQLIYLEAKPSHFSAREIKTGRASNGWVEIIAGLQEGDRVVFKGAFFIKSELAKGSFGHGHAH